MQHHNGSQYCPNQEIGVGEDLRYILCIAINGDEEKHGVM